MLGIRKGMAAILLLCAAQCVSAEETRVFMERLQEKESTALEAYTVDAEELINTPIVQFINWLPNTGEGWALAITGVVLGAGIEVGIAFELEYPCIGQIFKAIESTFFFGFYSVFIFFLPEEGYILYWLDELFMFFAMFGYMFQLFNVMSVDMCARGILYHPPHHASIIEYFKAQDIS